MATIVVRRGDNRDKRAGTCNQTGNNAPKPPWHHAIRVLIACIAYHLGYTDEQMARFREFPPSSDLAGIFNRTVPWFKDYWEGVWEQRAKASGYWFRKKPGDGVFRYGEVHGRLHYLYATPGSKKHSPKSRLYGISKEHHDSVEQYFKRKIVWNRCSKIMSNRLLKGRSITQSEIERWSKLPKNNGKGGQQ